MLVNQIGYQDYHFEQFDETITIGRPPVHACNLIIGQLYVDVDGQIEAINHKTGDRAAIKFNLKGWTDCHAFDFVRTKCLAEVDCENLTPWANGFAHVFLNGPLGAYMDHMKGPRKSSKSQPRDLLPQATKWARDWVLS